MEAERINNGARTKRMGGEVGAGIKTGSGKDRVKKVYRGEDGRLKISASRERRSIEEILFQILQKRSFSTIDLISEIIFLRPGTTKQGVYRVIRKLKREEKIVVYGKVVSLSLHWLKKMSDFFSLAQFYYLPKTAGHQSFLDAREGDKIVYFFKNLNLLDSFCTHAIYMFTEISDPEEPIFAYNPHEWFVYARKEVEQALIKSLDEKKRKIFLIATHNNPLDQELKKQFRDSLVKYHIADRAISKKDNYYFNIFGDYLLEIFFDPRTTKLINKFFSRTKVFDEKAREELLGIISRDGRNKVVISKDKRKAEKYKKFFAKYFFIKN